jgi:hypothetical protein
MRIFEVADPIASKLLALAQFAMARAVDEGGERQSSVDGFIQRARSLGIEVTPDQLVDMSNRPPLNGIMLPIQPNGTVIKFIGNESTPTAMPVNQAQEIVAQAAKSAARKDRSV